MASKSASQLFHLLRPSTLPKSSLRQLTTLPRPSQTTSRAILTTTTTTRRFAHAIPRPPSSSRKNLPSKEPSTAEPPASESHRPEHKGPAFYQLSFTCQPCGHRSHHNVSKQAYHHGSTLITCPGCRNRHVISDHLNIFGDRKITVEDLMREKGQLVKRGSLGEDGDIEFWPEEVVEQDVLAEGAQKKAGGSS
ncbi:DNL zinc finger domain-containing protein [Trichoderma longibrachiatum]|uniref:Zf-DNL-domain-containing protein n=1 Tax=Trichoderma longibrachiatum ATCC 18648 TaxID=983965 RepID=A0A2T4CDN1_TRILO|nr:zf-DNL-domain-containing protein [Trichoderma longibrachiatum ATCC 18648]